MEAGLKRMEEWNRRFRQGKVSRAEKLRRPSEKGEYLKRRQRDSATLCVCFQKSHCAQVGFLAGKI